MTISFQQIDAAKALSTGWTAWDTTARPANAKGLLVATCCTTHARWARGAAMWNPDSTTWVGMNFAAHQQVDNSGDNGTATLWVLPTLDMVGSSEHIGFLPENEGLVLNSWWILADQDIEVVSRVEATKDALSCTIDAGATPATVICHAVLENAVPVPNGSQVALDSYFQHGDDYGLVSTLSGVTGSQNVGVTGRTYGAVVALAIRETPAFDLSVACHPVGAMYQQRCDGTHNIDIGEPPSGAAGLMLTAMFRQVGYLSIHTYGGINVPEVWSLNNGTAWDHMYIIAAAAWSGKSGTTLQLKNEWRRGQVDAFWLMNEVPSVIDSGAGALDVSAAGGSVLMVGIGTAEGVVQHVAQPGWVTGSTYPASTNEGAVTAFKRDASGAAEAVSMYAFFESNLHTVNIALQGSSQYEYQSAVQGKRKSMLLLS